MTKNKIIFFILLYLFVSNRCEAQKIKHEVATQWFNALLPLTRYTTGYTPVVAARSFAYASLVFYEASTAKQYDYISLEKQLNGLKKTRKVKKFNVKKVHPETAANAALWYITERMYIGTVYEVEKATFDLYKKFDEKFKNTLSEEQYTYSVSYGKAVAEWIYQWSESDGGHLGFLKPHSIYYENKPGCDSCWKSQFIEKQIFGPVTPLHPNWGNNRVFIPTNKIMYQLAPPTPFSKDTNSIFYKEAIEVYKLSTEISKTYEGDSFDIVRFWDDLPMHTSTPAGHSIAILNDIIVNKNLDLHQAAKAYVLLTLSISDAFILVWKEKYKYNTVRPVTYIRETIDANFRPVLVTPRFPEYPSAHSVQSSAMATVLTHLFGPKYMFTSSSSFELFNPKNSTSESGTIHRSFSSFEEAAKEASLSRKLGGIHFETAGREGLKMGKQIAESHIRFLKFN